jgi:hypothetical protein
MPRAIYNSTIKHSAIKHPAISNLADARAIPRLVNCVLCPASLPFCVRILLLLPAFILLSRNFAPAADWHLPEQQLARKIVAVTGPGAIALTVNNRSSLGQRDAEIIQNGLRGEMEALGLRFARPEQAAATVTISLSENLTSFAWVAEIRQAAGESAVVMVATPRSGGAPAGHDSVPMALHKTSLWAQDDPILDVAVLEENTAPTHIAVLGTEKVSLYRAQAGKWVLDQAFEIAHSRAWPRDLRGRLVLGKDRLFDVYLPGVICQSTAAAPVGLNCRDSDDPWPLGGAGTSLNAFFSPARNFFTGAIAPTLGKFAMVPKFYSAGPVPREKYALWLFAATDGRIHLIDGVSERTSDFGWGSEIAGVKTACGSGWQILATERGDPSQDSIRAYEFPDRDPVAVTAPADLPGTITAVWTETKGDSAIAIVRNSDTGSYEAFRLAVACNQ